MRRSPLHHRRIDDAVGRAPSNCRRLVYSCGRDGFHASRLLAGILAGPGDYPNPFFPFPVSFCLDPAVVSMHRRLFLIFKSSFSLRNTRANGTERRPPRRNRQQKKEKYKIDYRARPPGKPRRRAGPAMRGKGGAGGPGGRAGRGTNAGVAYQGKLPGGHIAKTRVK